MIPPHFMQIKAIKDAIRDAYLAVFSIAFSRRIKTQFLSQDQDSYWYFYMNCGIFFCHIFSEISVSIFQ